MANRKAQRERNEALAILDKNGSKGQKASLAQQAQAAALLRRQR